MSIPRKLPINIFLKGIALAMIQKTLERSVVESDFSKLNVNLRKYDAGVITAFRDRYTYDESCAYNKQLLAFFLNKSYSIALVKGKYTRDLSAANSVELAEELFLIEDQQQLGMLFTDLKRLGNYLGQDSILFKPANENAMLYGTSDSADANPKKDETAWVSSAEQEKVTVEIFNRIPGRQFIVESVQVMEYPGTINGIRGLKIAAASLGF